MRQYSAENENSCINEGSGMSLDAVIADIYNGCLCQIERRILNCRGSHEDAADIMQNALEIVIKKKNLFVNKPKTLIRAYILGIGWKLWLKELQNQRENAKTLCEYAHWMKTERDSADLLALKKIELFYKCLNSLKAEDRRIVLEIKKGSKNKQIAEKFGYRIDAFKKKKSACLKALMKAIARDKEFVLFMSNDELFMRIKG